MDLSAIILCGGKASRMNNICKRKPKSMIEFQKKPFLEWLVLWLSTQGIEEIILSTGHLHKQIHSHFSRAANVIISHETVKLGTGGAVRNSLKKVTNNNIIVLNGDTLFFCDLKLAYRQHISSEVCATQIVAEDTNQNLGEVKIDNITGKVISHGLNEVMSNKNLLSLSSTGAYILSKSCVHSNFPDGVCSLEHYIVKNLIRKRILYSYFDNTRRIIDYGTPERLLEVKQVDLIKYYGVKPLENHD